MPLLVQGKIKYKTISETIKNEHVNFRCWKHVT